MLAKIEARILIFPDTDFHFPSTSVPPGTFLGSGFVEMRWPTQSAFGASVCMNPCRISSTYLAPENYSLWTIVLRALFAWIVWHYVPRLWSPNRHFVPCGRVMRWDRWRWVCLAVAARGGGATLGYNLRICLRMWTFLCHTGLQFINIYRLV